MCGVCVCQRQSPVRIRCHFHLPLFIFALFAFYFLSIFSSHFYLYSSLSAKNSCSSQASDSYAFQLFYHPPTVCVCVCVWNVPRGMLLVARSSLSCLIWSTHTPCVPSSKSICCCCWCAHTFLKLFFTKHFVVAPRFPSFSLRCFCWEPWPSLWHLVSYELSLSFFFCLSFSLSKPTLYTFITRAFMTAFVCVCVCIWRLCVYNQRSYSRCLRLHFLFYFVPSSFLLPLPLLGFASISCLIFMFLLFFSFAFFFQVQSW